MLKSIANIVKGIFGKKVTLQAPTYRELVEQLAWAEHEVTRRMLYLVFSFDCNTVY
ncbi:hypothetical protein [Paenibacillus pabuli]|uniref:hypothetical protein n=1 Tax=Paenibacillus pabuli TaxID=1472 RepID=UPI003CF46B47